MTIDLNSTDILVESGQVGNPLTQNRQIILLHLREFFWVRCINWGLGQMSR
jgi:hypothetical protein